MKVTIMFVIFNHTSIYYDDLVLNTVVLHTTLSFPEFIAS